MKPLKPGELRELSAEELNQKLETLLEEQYGLRSSAKTGKLEKPSRFRQLRRDIARVRTLIGELSYGKPKAGS
mgnify:CR=1 FL=1